jgi:mannosyltransferase
MSISLQDRKGSTRKTTALFADKSKLLLFAILAFAAFLRFFALDKQSLWLDELHTMNEASPTLALRYLFEYLTCCDQHPPLYFFCEKILFLVFGHTSMVARSLSALLGTASVWIMYLLGKELGGKRLGLIAAVITCVNFYNIQYSQEARDYIMAFFFSTLSFLYFFRLIKNGGRINSWLYALCALGVLYSHYFGLFLVSGQFFTAGILWLQDKPGRKRLFIAFLISAIIIFIGYIPWLPFLKQMAALKSFWIGSVDPHFVKDFFFGYFGNYNPLKPILLFTLILFSFHAWKTGFRFPVALRYSPVQLAFISFFITILFVFGIPYVRSLLVVPMLIDRYTIVAVPAFLMAIAFGFDLIPSNFVRSILIAAFLLFSLIDIFKVKKFYTATRKTQFRELTEYIVKNKRDSFPIVNERTSWHHQYYLDLYHYKGRVWAAKKETMVDSILSRSSPLYNIPGFWIVGAHINEAKLADSSRAALDTAYDLVKQYDFYDAWAQLYISKHAVYDRPLIIGYEKFPNNITTLGRDRYAVILKGAITSDPIPMNAGHYTMEITSIGHPSRRIFPHLKIFIDETLIGDFFVNGELMENDIDFELKKQTNAIIKIEMDNDVPDASGEQKAFISKIMISKN